MGGDVTGGRRSARGDRSLEAELRERAKELSTLYAVTRVLYSAGDRPLADRLQEVIRLLPRGWQYPDITEARLTVGGEEIRTAGFVETEWMLSAPIDGAAPNDRLQVAYTEARPAEWEGPFLREERDLLDALAASVGEAVRLRRAEERIGLITEHLDHVLWIRTEGRAGADYVSPAYDRVWGRRSADLYHDARSWMRAVFPADRERLERTAPHRSDSWTDEYRIVRPDGSLRWISERGHRVRAADGGPDRYVGVAEDITDRKLLVERFSVINQEITDIVCVLGVDDTVLLSSPSIATVTGYSSAEFRGSNSFAIVHPEDRPRLMDRLGALVSEPGGSAREEYRLVRKDGGIRHVESVARNLLEDPAVGGILLTTRDVTERLALEHRVREAQKLEAVGRLAGGIAHDFNNIMTVIRSQTELLLLEAPSRIAPDIELIQSSPDRAARLTAQLLAFSRDQVLNPEVVDVRAVLQGMDRMLDRAVGDRVQLHFELADDVAPIVVDPGQLEQVVMNLVVNARDAMPEGGVLTMAVRNVGAGAERCTVLEVRDTGIGMNEEVQAHMFEPFFTTKPHNKGTGLGLAMVYGVVVQSGGSIDVQSAPGEGTLFALRFPGVDGQPAQVVQPTAERDDAARDRRESPPATGCTVLVVEDDPAVRRVTCAILRREGMNVLESPDAELGLVAVTENPCDVLLTDLGLPGMSGRELAENVRRTAPSVARVIMSGYDVESDGERLRLPAGVVFLQKPFTRVTLVQAIRQALEGAAANS